MKKSVAALILLVPAVALAEPVYLDCTITSGAKGDVVWNVTLDESQGIVAWVVPALNTKRKVPAVFTADKVTFDSMEISRVDLSLVRTVSVLGETRVDRGQCKLVKPPARQF